MKLYSLLCFCLPLAFVLGCPPGLVAQLTVTDGLQLWLRADAGVVATGSGGVTQWDDQSGNANHATQSAEAQAPLLVSAALNNQPVLRFDGVDDFLEVADSDSLSSAGDIASFFVIKFDDFATFRAVWAKTAVNFPAPTDIYAAGNGLLSVLRGDGTADNLSGVSTAQPLRPNTYLVLGFAVEGTTLTHYLQNQENGSGIVTTLTADGNTSLKIGTRDDLFTKLKGDLAELLIYNRALSAIERSNVFDYLQTKYNLLNIPPSISLEVAPPGPEITVGETITLTATASDADGSINRVEFLANGALIATAIGAPYVARVIVESGGPVTFTARAIDDKDANATSSPVNLTAGPTGTPMLTVMDDLQLWLRADTGVSPGLDGGVLEWADQSGNANNAIQPDENLAPRVIDDGLNGLPVLRFDGTDDFLDVADSDSLSIVGDITSFFVVRFDDFATFRGVWGKTAGNLPAPTDFYAVAGNGIPRVFRGNGTGTSLGNADGTRPFTAGQFALAGFDMAGPTLTHYLNGAANGSGVINAMLADTDQPLKIGSRNDFVTRLKGDLAELLIYDAALSATDRRSVERYLAERYGFTLVKLTNQLPTIQLTSPASGASFGAPATVAAAAMASDADGIVSKVDFLVNGVVVATDSTAPYDAMLDFPAPDNAVITARATDNLGSTADSAAAAITVTATTQSELPRPENLKLWLRADEGVTSTLDGAVTGWEDRSGNLNHASQTDLAAAPLLVTDAVNGEPALRFDGVDDFMTVSNSPSVAIAGDISSFFVVRFDDFITFRAVWAKTMNNVPRATDWYALPDSGIPRLYRGGTGEGSVDGGAALIAGQYQIAGFDMAGTTARHYLDGVETSSGQILQPLQDTGRPLFIGTRDDRVTRMQGDIAEIIIYNAALSVRERNMIFRYLADKYGIVVTLIPDLLSRRSGSNVIISWPDWATDYVLESSPVVPETFWESVDVQPTVSGREFTVTLPISEQTTFFRLRQEPLGAR